MFNEHEPNRPGDEERLPLELAALVKQLARLAPVAPRLDRDRLMFEAGRASAETLYSCDTGTASALLRATGSASAGPSETRTRLRGQEEALQPERSRPVARGINKRASAYFWPAATATMTAATLFLSAMLVWRSPDTVDTPQLTTVVEAAKPQVVEPAVVSTEPSDAWPANWSIWPALGPPTSGYLAVRHAALTQGLAALEHESFNAGYNGTPSETRARPPATARELLEEFLPETTRNGSRS